MRAWVGGCVMLLALLPLTGTASAEFGVRGFDGQVTGDALGTPFTQAGGHPYAVSISVDFSTRTETPFPGDPVPWPEEPVKDILVDVPPGLVGNPTVVEQCTTDELATFPQDEALNPLCPAESQVGVVIIRTPFASAPGGVLTSRKIPLYSVVPPPTVPARFGFNVAGVVVTLDVALRSESDYGLSVNARNSSEGIAILGTDVTLWGTPADPAHDADRICLGSAVPGCTSTADRTPLLTLPTACTAAGVGLETSMRADSWLHPGVFKFAHFFNHLPPNYPDPGWPGTQQGVTGCDLVPFDASLTATPANPASPGASGYAFDLIIPQDDDPTTGIAPSELRKATVTLPEGLRVSPSAADGLEGCSSSQIALHSLADPTCPDESKIGSLTIDTPLLDQQLTGSIYLAKPHDNPSGSLLALYLVAKGPGLIIKLAGSMSPSSSGQISATFDNIPQTPFSRAHLVFNDGPRAPLSNPSKCGMYTTHAVLTSWSGKTVTSDSSFTTSHDGKGAPCPAPRFSPKFSAGTVNPVAGTSSPFTLTLSRSDDDDEFAALQAVHMPRGLLARISSLKQLCPAADMAHGTCGPASQIGSVTTAAGPGPNPFAVKGRVYFGGRYRGAPFSLSIAVPVVAGPFDLGTVVVRSAIFVDRHTADLDIKTDPLPTILQGIPLQVRLINVTIDRPKFMLNPTSCAEKRIAAQVKATTGRVANVSSRFQVGECGALGFDPKLTLEVGGKGHTAHGASTPLKTTLTQSPGESNLKAVAVSLPLSLNARLDVVNNACTQAAFDAGHCEQARAGSAVAVTPLLKHALRGGAYFVKDPAKPAGSLPNLVVALRGQVDFDLIGHIKIPGGTRLATRFNAPDVPIKQFTLRLVSGGHGPLGVSTNLCSAKARRATANVAIRGQDGDLIRRQQRLQIGGCAGRAHHAR